MSDIPQRLRHLFDTIAPPIDVEDLDDTRLSPAAPWAGWKTGLVSAVAVALFVGAGILFFPDGLSDPATNPTTDVPTVLDRVAGEVWQRTTDYQREIIADGDVSFGELQAAHLAVIDCIKLSGDWYVGGEVLESGESSISASDASGIGDPPQGPTSEAALDEALSRCRRDYFDDVLLLYVPPNSLEGVQLASSPFVWMEEAESSSPEAAAGAFARLVLGWPSPTVTPDPEGWIVISQGDARRRAFLLADRWEPDGPYGILQLGTSPDRIFDVMIGQAGTPVEEGVSGVRPTTGAEVVISVLEGAESAQVFLRLATAQLVLVAVPANTLAQGDAANRWVSIGETGVVDYLDIESVLVVYLDAYGRVVGATGGSYGPRMSPRDQFMVDCMASRGFSPAIGIAYGDGVVYQRPPDRADEFDRADAECSAEMEQEFGLFPPVDYAEFYGHLLETAECLVEQGYDPPPAPSMEVFLEQVDNPGLDTWHPYTTVHPANPAEWVRINRVCPQP